MDTDILYKENSKQLLLQAKWWMYNVEKIVTKHPGQNNAL